MEQPDNSTIQKFNCCCPAIFKLKQWAKNIKSKGKHQKKYSVKDQFSNVSENQTTRNIDTLNINYKEASSEHPQAAEVKIVTSREMISTNRSIKTIKFEKLKNENEITKASSMSFQDIQNEKKLLSPRNDKIIKSVLCKRNWDIIINELTEKGKIDFYIPSMNYKETKELLAFAEKERQIYLETLPSEYPARKTDIDIWNMEDLLYYYFLYSKKSIIDQLFPIHVQVQNSSIYELRSELGRGGFGIVFNCILYEDENENELLMKVPFPNAPKNNIKTFITEALVLESLSRLVYKDECTGILVYNKINGIPFHKLMKADYGDITKMTEYVEKYMGAVKKFKCDTNNQFYHGDIRPANIIVDESGEFHLIDFGSSFPVQIKNHEIIELSEKIKMRDEWCLQLSKIKLEAVMLNPDYRSTVAGVFAINDRINSLRATGRESIASALEIKERLM